MDADSELTRAKWLLLSGILFIVSCFICYSELMYFLRGQQTRATITEAYEATRRGRFGLSSGRVLNVEYTFVEPDGTHREGSDTVSRGWELPSDGTVPVQYTPGAEGRSRLAGHVNWFGIGFFVLSLGVLSVFGYGLWREASEATKSRPSKRRR